MARPRSDISSRIVHAARDRFLREGVDGASLRGIASDAGTSIGMVYYYYPTKDELFLAVVEERYSELLADLETTLDPARSVEDRIRDLYGRVGRMTDDELLVVRIVVREVLVSGERRRRIGERFARGHLPLILQLVVDGAASGALRRDVPAPLVGLSVLVLGLLPQVIRRMLGPGFPLADMLPSGEVLSGLLADIALDGVRASRAAAAPPTTKPSTAARARRTPRRKR